MGYFWVLNVIFKLYGYVYFIGGYVFLVVVGVVCVVVDCGVIVDDEIGGWVVEDWCGVVVGIGIMVCFLFWFFVMKDRMLDM